jgi:hypothetical protein
VNDNRRQSQLRGFIFAPASRARIVSAS